MLGNFLGDFTVAACKQTIIKSARTVILTTDSNLAESYSILVKHNLVPQALDTFLQLSDHNESPFSSYVQDIICIKGVKA